MGGRYAETRVEWDVAIERDRRVLMRDGVPLSVDLYRPAKWSTPEERRFPAILERTPYDKRRAVLEEAGRFFAARGYVVVVQDVRGRHRSEGEWYFLSRMEGQDGWDTVEWIARQPWCDGQVGTMGLSYSTATQQALAVLQPSALKTQILLDGAWDYHHRTLRHSGAFELGVLLPHAMRLAREGKELARDEGLREALDQALEELPGRLGRVAVRLRDASRGLPPAEARWFTDMMTRADRDDYWKQPTLCPAEHVDRYPDIPILLETSWYGHHAWATFEKYKALRARNTSPTRLVAGPWTHGFEDFERTWSGEADFGADSTLDLDDLRLRWFDHFLKGRPTGVLDGPPVRIFVMGGGDGARDGDGRVQHGGAWRSEEEWPPVHTRPERLYLRADRTLRAEAPPPEVSPLRYRFDPADPVPTIGGQVQAPSFPGFLEGGAFDQRGRRTLWACRDEEPLAARADVLVFQTEPLDEAMEVTGEVEVELWVSSSAVDTDFTAKLVDVFPDGLALNLVDTILRARYRNARDRAEPMKPEKEYRLTLVLPPVSSLFAAGHRVRLDVSSSNFPRFDVNPNTGEPLGRNRGHVVAENVVYVDAEHPSSVVLPIVEAPSPDASVLISELVPEPLS
jgi:putative CocE/NonD family hydrolase